MNTLLSTLTFKLIEKTLNTVISSDLHSQHKLKALEGKIFALIIDSPKINLLLEFHQHYIYFIPQTVQPSLKPDIATTHTTLHVAHAVDLLALLTRESGAMGNVPVTGEMSVLQNMLDLGQNLNPQLGRKLSPWIGATWAHRIEDMLTRGQSQLKMQTTHLMMHAKEWVQEDSQLLAPRWQMTQITRRLQALHTEIERLQAQLAALQYPSHQPSAVDAPAQLDFTHHDS